MSAKQNQSVESVAKEIRRNTCREYTAWETIRIVLEVLEREVSITQLFSQEGIVGNLHYGRSKDFPETGKRHLH